MKKFVISVIAVAGLAISASSAFAHGHLVTGSELYATPETAAPAQEQMAPAAHKTGVVRHVRRSPRVDTAS